MVGKLMLTRLKLARVPCFCIRHWPATRDCSRRVSSWDDSRRDSPPSGEGGRSFHGNFAHCTAAPAFTTPAPKNDVRLPSLVHWRGSSLGQTVGHARYVADWRIFAATAPCDSFGFICRINAATPAAWGEAMDVPLIQT